MNYNSNHFRTSSVAMQSQETVPNFYVNGKGRSAHQGSIIWATATTMQPHSLALTNAALQVTAMQQNLDALEPRGLQSIEPLANYFNYMTAHAWPCAIWTVGMPT